MTSHRIIQGDCIEGLRTLPDASVHCCVTSPPYWGLRDYGHDGQIGLESTPEAYVARMVEVFREVRRVLRDDGTCWVNLGDSYAAGGMSNPSVKSTLGGGKDRGAKAYCIARKKPDELKPKDLVGIPWRVAFALQADGWWLRQDIIWAKPNPMPESVRDRCTKAHEYVFLLTKSERYFYDAEAVSEALSGKPHAPGNKCSADGGHLRNDFGTDAMQRVWGASGRRNRRSVWTVTTKPYSGAHFAVMPAALVEPCIKAGCPEGGTVLDPFAGSGTTLAVAAELGRSGIGCELNPEYIELAEQRIAKSKAKMPLFVA
jgi:DNA modification methylase